MNLTETAYWTKRMGVIVLGAIVLLVIIILIIFNIPDKVVAPEYETPNYACTETKDEFLKEKLSIPTLTLGEGSDKVFQLETETGKIDTLPNIINVYKYANPGQTLNAQSEAKEIATKLGFNPNYMKREGSSAYYWEDATYGRKLTIQARNLTFILETDFSNDGSYPEGGTAPSDTEARSIAVNYLRNAGLMTEDYSTEQPYTTYIAIDPDGSLVQAKSKAEAKLVRVDFFRKKPIMSIKSNIEGADKAKALMDEKEFEYELTTIETSDGSIDVYNYKTNVATVDPNKGNISILVGPKPEDRTDTNSQVYGVEYANWYLESTACGTYELISAYQAFDIVQKGGGSLVYLNEKNGDYVTAYSPKVVKKFIVYNITIGYYDSPEEANYLQPIYIISGEATLGSGLVGKFYYYVPAINYDSVTDKVATPTSTGSTKTKIKSFF